jgi:hypothetical protein
VAAGDYFLNILDDHNVRFEILADLSEREYKVISRIVPIVFISVSTEPLAWSTPREDERSMFFGVEAGN